MVKKNVISKAKPAAFALLDARLAAGITQAELSVLAGVPQPTIARIENGHNTSVTMLTKLAAAFGRQLEIKFIVHKKK